VEAGVVAAQVRRVLRIEDAREREHDRVGVERRAVVEAHVVAQVERPHQLVVGDLVMRREPRLELHRARPPADEPFEHELADLDRLAVGHAREVERDHVGGARDDERAGIAPGVHRAAGVAACAAGDRDDRDERPSHAARLYHRIDSRLALP